MHIVQCVIPKNSPFPNINRLIFYKMKDIIPDTTFFDSTYDKYVDFNDRPHYVFRFRVARRNYE